MYLKAALPPPPTAFFSAIEHGRLHTGDEYQRMKEWQRMKGQGVKQGLCDLFIIAWGRFIAVELKKTTGLSDAQKAFRDACQANGQAHVVCRSVVELDAALRAIGLPIPRSMALAAMSHDAALSVPEPTRKPRAPRPEVSGEDLARASRERLQGFLDEG